MRPPSVTRTDSPYPCTTLFRSSPLCTRMSPLAPDTLEAELTVTLPLRPSELPPLRMSTEPPQDELDTPPSTRTSPPTPPEPLLTPPRNVTSPPRLPPPRVRPASSSTKPPAP